MREIVPEKSALSARKGERKPCVLGFSLRGGKKLYVRKKKRGGGGRMRASVGGKRREKKNQYRKKSRVLR